MKVEVLVTTMYQDDMSKYNEMNLQTDAVIANQTSECGFSEQIIDGKTVRLVSTDTRGASLNRNIALTYSKGDIIVFSDDDQCFVDGYEKLIVEAFANCPDADAIKFYCESTNHDRPLSFKRPDRFKKTDKKTLMSAGVHALAVKKFFLDGNNIFFDTRIGPGREIYCGEDSLFLNELLKHKANIYLSPIFLCNIKQEDSSWFKGFDEQFCISVGYIYSCLYGILAPFAALRRAFKASKNKNCNLTLKQLFFVMLKGIKKHRKRKK